MQQIFDYKRHKNVKAKVKEAIKSEFSHRCGYCGSKSKRLTLDHVLASSKEGIDSWSNLVPACAKCNGDKASKNLTDWYTVSLPCYSEERLQRILNRYSVKSGAFPPNYSKGFASLALHNRRMMQCSHCQSNQTVKNGRRKGTQSYLCRSCGRQFRETHISQGYPPEAKDHCLKLYVNGMGFRAIERVTGVCHSSVINWVKQAEQVLPDENYEIPETAQVDELQTFVGKKKPKFGSGLP